MHGDNGIGGIRQKRQGQRISRAGYGKKWHALQRSVGDNGITKSGSGLDGGNAMPKRFSFISTFGAGFALTNSWFGLSSALATGINAGGPALIIYGLPLMGIVSLCVGATLSELSSSMPFTGGQYIWASRLKISDKSSRLPAYISGWLSWLGAIFTSASVCFAVASGSVGCVKYGFNTSDTIKRWHVFLAYELVNIFTFIFNCYGKFLPTISTLSMWTSLISFFLIFITIVSVSSTRQPSTWVFKTFINNTGWSSSGLTFILGMVNVNWAFACLDGATQLASEMSHASVQIPRVIMSTVVTGFITAWAFALAILFNVTPQGFTQALTTLTGVPSLELFVQVLPRTAPRFAAVLLESCICLTGLGCLIASHTWQSRICWSFSQYSGLPWSKRWQHVNRSCGDIPLAAHTISCILVSICGTFYLFSDLAFNSLATACVVLLYLSYAFPVIGWIRLRYTRTSFQFPALTLPAVKPHRFHTATSAAGVVHDSTSHSPQINRQPSTATQVTNSLHNQYLHHSLPTDKSSASHVCQVSHGPFCLPRFLSLLCSCVTLSWSALALIMYAWPLEPHPNSLHMNYVFIVYVITVCALCVDWFLRARHSFTLPETSE